MIAAFRRLLVISLIALIVVFSGLFLLRTMGGKQAYSPLNHPLAQQDFLWIGRGGAADQAPSHTWPSFEAWEQWTSTAEIPVEGSPYFMVGLDLRLSRDGHWVLFGPDRLEAQTEVTGFPEEKTLEELRQLNMGYQDEQYRDQGLTIITLEEFLHAKSEGPLWLNIHVRYPEANHSLMKLLANRELSRDIIIHSPYRSAMRNLRKDRPLWLFAADSTSLDRMKFMSSLGLATLSDSWFDLVVLTDREPLTAWPESMKKELLHRHKLFIFDLSTSKNMEKLTLSPRQESISESGSPAPHKGPWHLKSDTQGFALPIYGVIAD